MSQSVAENTSNLATTAVLEIPQDRLLRDMHQLTGLISGLMRAHGQPIQEMRQTSGDNAEIASQNYLVRLQVSGTSLRLELGPSDKDGQYDDTEAGKMFESLLRASLPVLQPNSIQMPKDAKPVDVAAWIAGHGLVSPRRIRDRKRKKPGTNVAVWPDRPGDAGLQRERPVKQSVQTTEADVRSNYLAMRLATNDPTLPKREPLAFKVSSWSLTGATAALFPPAGAAMAVLNAGGRARLRHNLQALGYTILLLALWQFGVIENVMRSLFA